MPDCQQQHHRKCITRVAICLTANDSITVDNTTGTAKVTDQTGKELDSCR